MSYERAWESLSAHPNMWRHINDVLSEFRLPTDIEVVGTSFLDFPTSRIRVAKFCLVQITQCKVLSSQKQGKLEQKVLDSEFLLHGYGSWLSKNFSRNLIKCMGSRFPSLESLFSWIGTESSASISGNSETGSIQGNLGKGLTWT